MRKAIMPRHTTERYLRERKQNPKKFDPRSFRVIDPGRPGHTKMIVACPKGYFSGGKCKVGMQVQAVLKERKPGRKTERKRSLLNEIARRHGVKL